MNEFPSLIGKQFGKLTVVEQLSSQKGYRRWLCRCECGGTKIATTGNLNSGGTTSCGCNKHPYPDLTGKVFGRLEVLRRSDKRNPRGARTNATWECRCECGAIIYRATNTLTNQFESMCNDCQMQLSREGAHKAAGFIDGTQVSKLRDMSLFSSNTSGCRGVSFDKKADAFRAYITFKGKQKHLGYFRKFEEAVAARKDAEEKYFQSFLEQVSQNKNDQQESSQQLSGTGQQSEEVSGQIHE